MPMVNSTAGIGGNPLEDGAPQKETQLFVLSQTVGMGSVGHGKKVTWKS